MAKIVIAEDQAHIRHVLTMWMSRHGHDVLEAANGRAALSHLESEAVELLITDVNMPEMSGIELTKAGFDVCPTLRRVFVVTSRCDQQEILAVLSDPRVSVFPKPFSPSQLLNEVQMAVGAPDASSAPGARPAAVAPAMQPPSGDAE